MQLRFGGSRCNAEHVGDLFVFVAFDVVQDEYAACAWRKLGDRVLQIEEIAWRQRHSDDTWQRVHSTCLLVILLEA